MNTHALLEKLGIDKASVVGHSTGGMLATRYALMYPKQTEKLVMVNPIGLEDWKALGVPYRSVDQWYERELKTTAEGIRAYEQKTYYDGRWKPEYDKWVDMLAGLNKGPGHKIVAWNSALIYDMIFTQPVFYEFPRLQVPTVLMIGDADTTAIGSDIAPPEVKAKIGNYKVLGKQVAQMIPGARLVEFKGKGMPADGRSAGLQQSAVVRAAIVGHSSHATAWSASDQVVWLYCYQLDGNLYLISVKPYRPDLQTLFRVLNATTVVQTKMLLVQRRGNHQLASDMANQSATDHIGTGLGVAVVDGKSCSPSGVSGR